MSYKYDMNFMWESVKMDLAAELTQDTVDTCFGEMAVDTFDGSEIVFSTPSYVRHKQINRDYIGLLEEKFKGYLGYNVKVTVNYSGESTEAVTNRLIRQITGMPPEEEPQKKSTFVGGTLPPFNFEYTFDNFIVGNSNKFAHAACWAVSERPALDYNPLFIYGPSGLGKTHLLYAITNAMKQKNPDLKVIYIKGEDFTNQMINSLAEQSMQKFRNKYRSCDMLLIDDIQFIAGKVSTQEEFFHTFNALFEDRKQIILTSDRPPRDIKTLEERLKTRFEWGLIADIQPPDMELRVAIIKKKAEQVNVTLPEEVLTFLSENLRSNIRQIEGAIKKLGAMSFLSGRKITMELAKGCISELLGGAEPTSVTVDKVFSVIYKRYNIKKEEIIGTRRTKEIAMARHLAVYLVRTITEMSLPNIGKIFNRNHTTILSSIECAEKRLRNDPILEIEINEMIKEVTDQN